MNHDHEYHGAINYGNLYPDDWYWMKPPETFSTSNEEDKINPIKRLINLFNINKILDKFNQGDPILKKLEREDMENGLY